MVANITTGKDVYGADVYKRQVLLLHVEIVVVGVERVETDGMFLGIGKIHAVLTFGPVSYTHLDVYKRQVPSSILNSPRPSGWK